MSEFEASDFIYDWSASVQRILVLLTCLHVIGKQC